MSVYSKIRDLSLEIEDYRLEPLVLKVAGGFERHTTVVHLRGGGQEGVGEDVTYQTEDQKLFQEKGAEFKLAGKYTLAEFSALLDEVKFFSKAPAQEASRYYRRWAFESAALSLALKQNGRKLHEVLELTPRPVRFVVSPRLGDPSSAATIKDQLSKYPDLRYKLDPANDWTDELIAELADLNVTDTLDLKGFYRGTPVDVKTDPVLYRKVAEAFPNAWLEDADLNDETRPVLEPHAGRLTWDYPIHAAGDIENRPYPPKMINMKPSRCGTLENLFGAYEYCETNGIGVYGGGQFELGPGRRQIQYLASLFHPDGPNDVAPGEYNLPELHEGLQGSPLSPEGLNL